MCEGMLNCSMMITNLRLEIATEEADYFLKISVTKLFVRPLLILYAVLLFYVVGKWFYFLSSLLLVYGITAHFDEVFFIYLCHIMIWALFSILNLICFHAPIP